MSQVGRISGPLLTANLERNGINLTFRNTSSDTQLLFLDVNNGKIGVNKGVAGYELDINGMSRSTNLLSTTSTIANFTIENNNINVLVGNINLVASEIINLSALGTDNINIDDNIISSFNSNSNIDLRPNGTGNVDVFSNLEVYGNLHSNQNITLDGTITFGDTISQDTIEFNTEVNSDINPNTNDAHQLGSIDKRWNALYTNLVNGTSVSANSLIISGLDYNLKLGNIFYVSVNGDDTNSGDSVFSPFATVKHALAAADASTAGPVTIQIYPGEYQEQLPLTVPSNVTVQGFDMRNTIIVPDTGSQSEDVFLLNGESTIQNLTIKDFYAPGYAFKFAPNAIISTRSPYVQNVTVITRGITTSASDPRGFASGDAGGGAYIDGNSVNSASNEASMLFHSCTFITPGVDAVTMTNGVRVEWLNSFTYFANRGLYAVDGVDGHLSTDGSTVKYGAELRSIGSANVYGNYGAVADGVDTLMYLIQHNFGYIGVGKYVDNDASIAIQANEVVKLNSGKIYYQSVNHFGNFRVGEQFFIDQESGNTSIVLTEAEVDSLNSLVINSGGQTTIIDGEKIDIGDFTIAGNLLKTNTQAFNVASANDINFTSNVAISKNLTMTGDITIGGTLITLGNEATDTINFNTPFSQDIEPDISGLYNLGSANKKWIKSWLGEANISDVQFNENYITTTVSNADLELRANATGRVYLPNNSLVINNATTINGTTDLQNVNTTGTITQTGNTTISNGASIVGAAHVTGIVTIGAKSQLENILIDGNLITTTASNSDLDLRASGTGTIRIPNNNVLVSNAFTANDITGTNLYVQSAVALNDIITSGQIKIDDNFITTTLSNSNLELRANGTGGIRIEDDILFNQNIVSTTEDLNLTSTGNVNITSSSALLLSRGSNAQRVNTNAGNIRFSNCHALL